MRQATTQNTALAIVAGRLRGGCAMLRLVMIVSVVAACTDSIEPGPTVTSVSERLVVPLPLPSLGLICIRPLPIECNAWTDTQLADGTFVEEALPLCDDTADSRCYKIYDSPQLCPGRQRFEMFNVDPPPGTRATATLECLR
ncbi:MAG: hypothetical protein ABI867_34570 [Kofleriaceae bacterium]